MSNPVPLVFQISANLDAMRRQLASAEVSLQTTRQAVTRMGNALDGTSLIAQANAAVKVVNDLGGVSKLAAAEQARVNQVVTQALEKYRALGREAPPALVQLAEATKKIEQSTAAAAERTGTLRDRMRGLAGDALASATGFLTAQGAIAAVKGVAAGVVGTLDTLIMQGSAASDVAGNFAQLTTQAGLLGDTLLGSLRSGTHRTIDDLTLMKTVNQDLTAGMRLSADQFGTLARGAFALAQATGVDAKAALDTMNDAMLTGRTRALALLTGKIDLAGAEEIFARSIGTTADRLNDEGKLQAARAAILDSVARATERLGDQTDGLDERVAQVHTSFTNFQDALGRSVAESPVLQAAFDAVQEAITGAVGTNQETLVQNLTRAINRMALQIPDVIDFFVDFGIQAARVLDDIERRAGSVGTAVKRIGVGAAAGAAMGSAAAGVGAVPGALIGGAVGAFLPVGGSERTGPSEFLQMLEAGAQKSAEATELMRKRMQAAMATADAFVGPLQAVGAQARRTAQDVGALTRELPAKVSPGEKQRLREEARELERNAPKLPKLPWLKSQSLDDAVLAAESARIAASAPTLDRLPKVATGGRSLASAIGSDFRANMMGALEGMPQLLAQGLASGGNMVNALSGATSSIAGAFGKSLGAKIGALGSLGGPVGAAIGSLAGPLMERLFFKGPSKQEQDGRSLVDSFQKSFGGFNKMMASVGEAYRGTGRSAEEAQRDVKALLDAEKQGPDAVQAWLDKITGVSAAYKERLAAIDTGVGSVVQAFQAAGGRIPDSLKDSIRTLQRMEGLTEAQKKALGGLLDDVRPDFAALQQKAEGFGISLAGLGPKFAQGRVQDRARELAGVIGDLQLAGGDMGGILLGMSDEISQLVNDSLKFGTTIPDNMKPFIESIAKAGKLTDDNGNAITDLTKLSFAGTPLEKGIQSLVDKVGELIDRLNDVPRNLDVTATLTTRSDNTGIRGGDVPEPVYGGAMAEGGFGVVDRPTIFLAGEAGREQFAFSGANKTFDRMPGGNVSVDMSSLERRFDRLADRFDRMPDLFALKVRDHMIQRGRR